MATVAITFRGGAPPFDRYLKKLNSTLHKNRCSIEEAGDCRDVDSPGNKGELQLVFTIRTQWPSLRGSRSVPRQAAAGLLYILKTNCFIKRARDASRPLRAVYPMNKSPKQVFGRSVGVMLAHYNG